MVGRAWFWVLVISSVLVLPVGRALFRRLPPALPVIGAVPPFSLLDQSGAPFGSRDLEGRAWLAAPLSTTSPESDRVGEELRLIQHRAHHLGADFRVVSITTDPERDSPPDLAAFVEQHHGSPRMWTFVTGDPREVAHVLAQLPALPGESRSAFVLVDAHGRARSIYDPLDPATVERVLLDLSLMVNRGG